MKTEPANPLDTQVSGDHYKALKIQPVEYIHANSLPFCEASVVKYVTRWRSKGGIRDLEKAKHFIDLLIELETRDTTPKTEPAPFCVAQSVFGVAEELERFLQSIPASRRANRNRQGKKHGN